MRRLIRVAKLLALVAVFLCVFVRPVIAQTDGAAVFTGCLHQTSGVLRNVAVGLEPARPCNDEEVQISWDRADPAVAALIADLDERLGLLETGAARFVHVDCAQGETITGAMNDNAGWPGRLVIRVAGVCEESVSISRNDVYIGGETPEDGVRAPIGQPGLAVIAATDAVLHNLTIFGSPEGSAISLEQGASVRAFEIRLLGGGIWVNAGSYASVYASRIEDGPGFGVAVTGDAELVDCEVRGFDIGLYAQNGGSIQAYTCLVAGNQIGVSAFVGGHIRMAGSSVESNAATGVNALNGSAVEVRDQSRIALNGAGAVAGTNSALNIEETEIYGNATCGIELTSSSTLTVFEASIHDNEGDGIVLRDLSVGIGGWGATGGPPDNPNQIFDNGGWGIDCAGPPAIQAAQNGFEMAYIDFSGNALGDTNCP